MLINLANNTKADDVSHFRVCLGNKANDHFEDDGSIIGEFTLIAGLPYTSAWDLLDCALHVTSSESGISNPKVSNPIE